MQRVGLAEDYALRRALLYLTCGSMPSGNAWLGHHARDTKRSLIVGAEPGLEFFRVQDDPL